MTNRVRESYESLYGGNPPFPYDAIHLERQQYPVTYAQQSLWLHDQLYPDSPAYNVAIAVRLEGTLDLNALNQSLKGIVRRHSAFRTSFVLGDSGVNQIISSLEFAGCSMVDLTDLPHGERLGVALDLANSESRKVFDLARGQLFRALIIRLSPEDHILAIITHHISFDSWSLGILLGELRQCYSEYTSGRVPRLPSPSFNQCVYALRQRDWLSTASARRQLSFWKEQLSKVPPYITPGLRASFRGPSDRTGGRLQIAVPMDVEYGTKMLGRDMGVTVYMVLLAAWTMVLHKHYNQASFAVSSPTAGRQKEIEQVIGYFINTLVLAVGIDRRSTFREHVGNIRRTTLDALSNRIVPYELIIQELDVEHRTGLPPFSQLKFIYQNVPGLEFFLPGLDVTFLNVHTDTAKFDLMLDLTENSAGINGRIEYSTALFELATVEVMREELFQILRAATEHPDAKVDVLINEMRGK